MNGTHLNLQIWQLHYAIRFVEDTKFLKTWWPTCIENSESRSITFLSQVTSCAFWFIQESGKHHRAALTFCNVLNFVVIVVCKQIPIATRSRVAQKLVNQTHAPVLTGLFSYKPDPQSNYKIQPSFATTSKTRFILCSLRSLHVSAFTRGHLQVITCKHKKIEKVTIRYNGSVGSNCKIIGKLP
jgi:hypothetical protein